MDELGNHLGDQPKKYKKDPIQWSEPLEAILAAQVYNRKAYIKSD